MLSKLFLVSNYLYQYDYYVNVLCKNKELQELKCNGTCHLAKELKAVDSEPSNPELPAQLKVEPVLFFEQMSEVLIAAFPFQIDHPYTPPKDYAPPFLEYSLPPPKV